MNRRNFVLQTLAVAAGIASAASRAAEEALGTVQRPRSFWKPLLSAAAYAVLFEEDTERPFSSPLNQEKRAGTFLCAACQQPLFGSSAKYESGTGWPSFWQPLAGALGTRTDRTLFVERTEYHCSRCGGHHGHVFDDGPQPTGLRYCNNGVALTFVPQGTALPALRG